MHIGCNNFLYDLTFYPQSENMDLNSNLKIDWQIRRYHNPTVQSVLWKNWPHIDGFRYQVMCKGEW